MDVIGNGTDLVVWHELSGSKNLPQSQRKRAKYLGNGRQLVHAIRSGNCNIEVNLAVLDLLNEVIQTGLGSS